MEHNERAIKIMEHNELVANIMTCDKTIEGLNRMYAEAKASGKEEEMCAISLAIALFNAYAIHLRGHGGWLE